MAPQLMFRCSLKTKVFECSLMDTSAGFSILLRWDLNYTETKESEIAESNKLQNTKINQRDSIFSSTGTNFRNAQRKLPLQSQDTALSTKLLGHFFRYFLLHYGVNWFCCTQNVTVILQNKNQDPICEEWAFRPFLCIVICKWIVTVFTYP